ncbi:MAG: hypothetical protein HQL60_02945 [Magnetococcales bacterium]|nr:hypothetical protein [Magnetococcales bacterium]
MRYDTTLKDLFKQPPQRLLQLLAGQQAVEVLTGIEFPSTQKRVPDLVFKMLDRSIFHLELLLSRACNSVMALSISVI